MRTAGLVAIMVSGCFFKPASPAIAVDARADVASDAAPPCTSFGPWSTPVLIVEGSLSSYGENAPSLASDDSELWYAQLGSVTGTSNVVRSEHSVGTWSAPQRPAFNSDGQIYADPFLSDDRKTLWMSRGVSPTLLQIVEAKRIDGQITLTVPIGHTTLGHASGASLTSDGLTIYFTTLDTTPMNSIAFATRKVTSDEFGPSTPLTCPGKCGDPSISGDGKSIVYTDKQNSPFRLYQGEISGGVIINQHFIDSAPPAFQTDPVASYFDADLSRDGSKLMYGADLQANGRASRIFRVTRTCMVQ